MKEEITQLIVKWLVPFLCGVVVTAIPAFFLNLRLIKNGLQINASFSSEELSSAALSDKKRKGNEISLVIPKRIGECYLKKVNISEIPHVFEAAMEDK